MRIVLDECVSDLVAAALSGLSEHEVSRIGSLLGGASDASVLDAAHRAGALLVTCDKDFGELLVRDRLPSTGVLLYRTVGRLTFAEEAALIALQGDNLLGALTVVSPDSTRVRRLEP